jgi:hypothetical protein
MQKDIGGLDEFTIAICGDFSGCQIGDYEQAKPEKTYA